MCLTIPCELCLATSRTGFNETRESQKHKKRVLQSDTKTLGIGEAQASLVSSIGKKKTFSHLLSQTFSAFLIFFLICLSSFSDLFSFCHLLSNISLSHLTGTFIASVRELCLQVRKIQNPAFQRYRASEDLCRLRSFPDDLQILLLPKFYSIFTI